MRKDALCILGAAFATATLSREFSSHMNRSPAMTTCLGRSHDVRPVLVL